MILYFTGTGNSRFAAEFIADRTGDRCVSLNEILKNKRALEFSSEKPFVIAAPVYASSFPRIVVKLIRRAVFSGSNEVYFIATMGAEPGKCEVELAELAKEKGMEYKGFCGIRLPNNYIVGGNVPDSAEAERIIEEAVPVLESVSDKISAGEHIGKDKIGIGAKLMSHTVNGLFNVVMDKMNCSKKFTVSDDCIACGRCASVCPVNNIIIMDTRPVFREKCVNCLACINSCPMKAINYGGKTADRNRYVCPDYGTWKKLHEEDE